MTCLCRHRGEAEVWLQPIRNSALEGGGWLALRSGSFTPGKDSALTVEGGWVGPWAGLKVMEIPNQPGLFPGGVRSESLQGLSYPDSTNILTLNFK